MRTLTYYLPDENDAPLPPEGFHIIGYETLLLEQVDIGKLESYRYAVLPLLCLEDNFAFACIATDENIEIYYPASLNSGVYADQWRYMDDGEKFDLTKYREEL